MIPLYDTIRPRKFPFVNWLLISINILAFLYELQLNPGELRGFIEKWGIIPAQLISNSSGEWETLFSAMFLHGGWFHILSNMWVLFIFGDNVEDRMGGFNYVLFYL